MPGPSPGMTEKSWRLGVERLSVGRDQARLGLGLGQVAEHDAVAAGMLGGVEREVGALQRLLESLAVGGELDQADADGEAELAMRRRDANLGYRDAQALGDLFRFLERGHRQHGSE